LEKQVLGIDFDDKELQKTTLYHIVVSLFCQVKF